MLIGNIADADLFPQNIPQIPDFSKIDWVRVLRTKGTQVDGESLGAGFLRKNLHDDRINWCYPNFVLVTVLHGTGLYVDSKGLEYPLVPGSTFLRIPNLIHSNFVDVKSEYLECYIEVGPLLYRALCGMKILNTSSPVNTIDLKANPNLPNRIWQIGWKLTYLPDEDYAECTADMISIIGEYQNLFRSPEKGERYRDLVELACRRLGTDFQKDFSMQEFCRKHSVGYENFRKLFRTRTGVSPCDYRIRQRMQNAIILLLEKNYSITEIAEQLGYSSVNEFSAQFRKRNGVSPAEFRKMH